MVLNLNILQFENSNLHVDFEVALLFFGWSFEQALERLEEAEYVYTTSIISEQEETPTARVWLAVPVM